MPDSGNAAQTRIVAEQVAEAVISRFVADHPEIRRAEIPAPLKWAGAIAGSLMVAGVGAMALWLVSTVNDMQVTLARMDERMSSQDRASGTQYEELARRVSQLEAYHAKGN